MNKKLIYIAPANSVHSHRWADYFIKNNWDFIWYSLYESTEQLQKTFNGTNPVVIKPTKFKLFNLLALVLIANYTRFKYKIRLVHGQSAGVHGFATALIVKCHRIITVWGSDILINAHKRFLKYPIKFTLKRADEFTCDAEHMKNALVTFGINPNVVHRINFGVDTRKIFKKGIKKSDKILTKYKLNEYDYTILSLRVHYEIYDIETLIKSIAIVSREINNVKLLIGATGPLTENYKKLVDELNIGKFVIFTGRYEQSDLVELFSAVDLYVSTALSDGGLASSTAEAMSCEVPVIISDVVENSMWISDSRNGYLFRPSDPVDLSNKIISCYKNADETIKAGRDGRNIILQSYDYNNEMKKMEEIYKETA